MLKNSAWKTLSPNVSHEQLHIDPCKAPTHLGQVGIFPDGELVLREPVPGDELLVVRVPNNARNLAARVLAGYLAASLRVPNPKQKFSLTAIG